MDGGEPFLDCERRIDCDHQVFGVALTTKCGSRDTAAQPSGSITIPALLEPERADDGRAHSHGRRDGVCRQARLLPSSAKRDDHRRNVRLLGITREQYEEVRAMLPNNWKKRKRRSRVSVYPSNPLLRERGRGEVLG